MASAYTMHPDLGVVLTQTGAAIKAAYAADTVGTVINVGQGVAAVRFYVRVVLSGGSSITSVTLKLKHRYSSDFGWIDLYSRLEASTLEVEHTFGSLSAGNTYDRGFYFDAPRGTKDIVIDAKADNAGTSTDSLIVRAVCG